MIEDKEDGIVIANEEEAYWTQIKNKVESEIEALNKQKKYLEAVSEMCSFRISLEAKKENAVEGL